MSGPMISLARVVWAVFAFAAAWACGLAVAASLSGSPLVACCYALLGAFVEIVAVADRAIDDAARLDLDDT